MPIERIAITSRDQWLALRMQDITASDVGAVCGHGLYHSAARVYAEKRGDLSPAEMNEAMKRGIWGEPSVVEALSWERPDWQLRRAKVYMRDPELRLGATPDCGAIDPERDGVGVVQCKIVAAPVFADKWLKNPEDNPHDVFAPARPPIAYELQTLTEGALAEAQWGVIAALIVDTFKWTLRLFPVDRHEDAEAAIKNRVAAFWRNHLIPGIPPPIDAQLDDELVKTLYPRDDGSEIDLRSDNEFPGFVHQLLTARATKSEAEKIEKVAKTNILAKIGAHSRAVMADGRIVTAHTTDRAGYEVKPTSFRTIKVSKV